MNVPYNKSHTGSHVVQEWMDKYFGIHPMNWRLARSNFRIGGPLAIDVYVISFNSNWLIEYQIKCIRKFLAPPFNIIIVDNNNWLYPEVSQGLSDLCEKEDVCYLKAPDNHYQEEQHFDSTMKLGTTLSWLFHNVVKQRKPDYFFFLDDDCFLVKPFDPRDYLEEKGMYGTVSRNLPYWNLHVIANGFKFDFVKDEPLDFRASYKFSLDTGGANYGILYNRFKMEDYMLEHTGHRYTEEDIASKEVIIYVCDQNELKKSKRF